MWAGVVGGFPANCTLLEKHIVVLCIVLLISFQMFVHEGTVCRKAEEHLWAGVVGGFPANCTAMGKLLCKCGKFFLY